MTTSHYSIAVGNRAVFGKNNGSSGSGQTTGFTVQNLRAARHNGQSKQIKLQRFERFKGFRMSEIFQVSPCGVAQYRIARKIRTLFCGIGFGPVFPEFCGPQRHITGTARVSPPLSRFRPTRGLRTIASASAHSACKTIDMETNLPTILQCAPLPTLQCDSRNYYSKLLAQGRNTTKK